ncbi:hypothetical protein MRX96_013021 [Rhipicephalus microplus]
MTRTLAAIRSLRADAGSHRGYGQRICTLRAADCWGSEGGCLCSACRIVVILPACWRDDHVFPRRRGVDVSPQALLPEYGNPIGVVSPPSLRLITCRGGGGTGEEEGESERRVTRGSGRRVRRCATSEAQEARGYSVAAVEPISNRNNAAAAAERAPVLLLLPPPKPARTHTPSRYGAKRSNSSVGAAAVPHG